MLEKTLERKLKTEVEKHGGQAWKFTSPGRAGVPDRQVLLPGGRVVFVELKAPGKPLRPLQKKRFEQLAAMGFTVVKIDNLAGIEEFIQEVFGDEI